jgi:hypothetical protein
LSWFILLSTSAYAPEENRGDVQCLGQTWGLDAVARGQSAMARASKVFPAPGLPTMSMLWTKNHTF